MTSFSLRSALIAVFVLSNCISWTTSRHHYTHNVSGHRSRHRRQGQGLFLSASYVIPGGEGSGWGEWGEVSSCSRTCGGGVASQKRICLQIGSDGQPQCSGGDTKYFSCQTQDCPAGSPDFRAQQCSKYDDAEFRSIKYKWVPYLKAPNSCELNCMPQGQRFYYRHQTKVVDGTRCNEESFDVCVNGICEPVGCDMMLGSSAREDKCRVCRGNNDNCQTIKGVHDAQDALNGYNDILIIPKGATSIIIEERAKSNNYLALRAHNGSYYLNGDYHIDFPRSFSIAGALWIYERSQLGFEAPDKLRCLGPINEPLYLAILLQGPNVGIDYEYSLPSELAPPRNKQYNWVHDKFTPCSAPCGGGFQVRNVTCRSREELELVDEALCEQEIKPATNQSCNLDACAAEWTPGPWGQCSKRCGKGGTRSREVHCMQIISNGYPSIVDEKKCFDLLGEKPEVYQKCNENATCPLWFTGPWKPCSKLCDEGKQTRQVVCYQKNGRLIEKLTDDDCDDEKPVTEQACMLQPCDGVDWVTSEWSKCDSCLSKEQTRTVVCATVDRKVVDDSFCAYHSRPNTTQTCDKTLLPPCEVQWYATQWSNCSAICGKGFQYRKVFCGMFDGATITKVDDNRCAKLPKYNDTKECEVPKEKCPSQWFAGPWTACNVTCGEGVRFRRTMCLANNVTAKDCSEDDIPTTYEKCNEESCDKDTTKMLDAELGEDDYDDCEGEEGEAEEEYAEAGLEVDSLSTLDIWSTMFSDSPTEGSGMWTSTTLEQETEGSGWTSPSAEQESEFTLTTDELLTTEPGSGSSTTDFTGISTDDSTDVSISEDTAITDSTTEHSTVSTNAESTTESDKSSSTSDDGATGETSPNPTSETGSTSATDTDTTATGETSESGSTSSADNAESTTTEKTTESGPTVSGATDLSSKKTSSKDIDDHDYDEYTGLTDDELRSLENIRKAIPADVTEPEDGLSKTTESDLSSKVSTESVDSSDKTTIPFFTFAEEDELTPSSEKEPSEETTPTDTTDDSSTTESEGSTPSTEETDSTVSESSSETSPSSVSEVTTESSETETTDETQSTSEVTTDSDITESSTESDATTESISASELTTESKETETGDTGSTESSESVTTEITDTSSSDSTTESSTSEVTSTSETKTSESPETTESGSENTSETIESSTEPVTTESGSTESGSTESGTTESGTTESGTTESETTESGITESGTTESGTTESGTTESGITESGTTESGTTESGTTESGTSESGTTESGTSESGTTELGTTEPETTEFGTTESEITVSGSTEYETTEKSTEISVTGESTTGGSTEPTEEESSVSSEDTQETTPESTTEGKRNKDAGNELHSFTVPMKNIEAKRFERTGGTWDKFSLFTTKKPRVCRPRSCKRSKFGCCPDKKTPALGPFDLGCTKPKTCKESIFECCPDGLSPAQGPDNEGCPVEPCAETLFGCCESDNTTAAEGNFQEGCPPPLPACRTAEFGCCKDGESPATGPGKEGCPETSTTVSPSEDTETPEPTTSSSSEVTVTAADICAQFEFGCCSDNKTAALGPEKQGCPCSASEYGCCPDGVTEAQGLQLEGCAKSCNDSSYGCCPDDKTPAHGDDLEGCCLIYPYGCCPDSHTPARGPHLEGCACQDSRFGCCPDNVTVATGPDNKGCGCQYTKHGCCPDRHSEASGPEYDGCLCHTYQFGCCPDGVTIAEGPRGQGCYCQQSKYGCCGDEKTHAKGDNKQGCNCANSRHGCCLDGITEATGPKFQGCSEKPENKQAACSLAFERGTCQNFSIKWYYDAEYGGCSRFWYGGCDGNGNRFSSKEECEDICVSPPPKDACKLRQIKGACTNYHQRWYYDNESEMCSYFIYGGCLGNNNNFETQELCQAQCEPERTVDQCKLPTESGSCRGNYPRWGYNYEEKRCEQFVWGGCEGNSNRFGTEAACLLRCNPPGEPQPECLEPQEVGNCSETEAMWSFSQSENRCVPFYYTGCGGNGNRYYTRDDCEGACPSAYVPELCTLPASTGDCADYREKWYFDTTYQTCRQFYYGGCGGNGNKFETEQECAAHCTAVSTPAPPTEPSPRPAPSQPQHPDAPDRPHICFLEIDSGPCSEPQPKWGYDYLQGKCVNFTYGGCAGNQNNFPSEDDCSYYCKPTQDLCQLPMLSGPCNDSVMSWFYDASTDSCSQFTYGGCDGNENRFNSRDECESRCRTGPVAPSPPPDTTTVSTTVKIEHRFGESVPAECTISTLEECNSETRGEVWYYDPSAQACTPHENLETGDGCRTVGTFYSQEACERSCGVFRNIDVCKYQLDVGPCKEIHRKYHYNTTSQRCEEFAYGGCFGSPNRFSTEQECQQICMTTVDPCTLPAESGNCLKRIVMWYYDQRVDQCNQFVYGGCGGNENKFESRESCEGRCRREHAVEVTTPTPRQPEQEECRTPTSLEPCGRNITVFYYNEATRTCDAAAIGDCQHPNSYRSEEECERRCGAFKDVDVCRYELDPGPCRDQATAVTKFYFDAASGRCRSYTYGGCQGGPNRFSSTEECEEICSSAGPDRACLQEPSVGEQCGAVPERRWQYDVERRDCLVFAYQGCGGGLNNFPSYEECAYLCRVAPSDTEETRICSQYSDECSALETRCPYGVKTELAAEGCERCTCEEPVDCEPQRRECEALRCRFGTERTTGDGGCEKCKCFEDPCVRSNCSVSDRCVVAAYKDPTTQEIVYSAHCVPNEETNEVLPDCNEYINECARISCPYAVQRTRTSHGCERCTCVQQEVDCSSLERECEQLRCNYGVAQSRSDDGCVRCKCYEHPCDAKICESGKRCIATPFGDPITREQKYSTACETINKPGQCPEVTRSEGNTPASHICSDDADCRGILKCCSQACVMPEEPTQPPIFTTHKPDIPHAPEVNVETEPEIIASEGGKATLRCLFHGNPPPRITWRFGEISIDSDVDRYRLLSDGALEIVSLYRNDSGVYICIAANNLGTAEQQVTLQVHDPVDEPAGIAGEPGAAVTGELDGPATLRCLAYGYPAPAIYWFSGGSMVPFSSSLYLARGQELLIRRLSLETLGEYLCQAYNGVGSAATMVYRVQAYRPSDDYDPGNEYLVPRLDVEVAVTPRVPFTTKHATPLTTTVEIPFYPENVSTRLLPATTSFSVGAQVTLPCEVSGYPEPQVHWTKDNVQLTTSDAIWISDARLTIKQAQVNDSGLYGCHAANAYSSHSSTVHITVQERYIPAKCVDNPTFAKCTLIVQGRFCQHPYYSKFCCKSCVEAGQLDPRDAEMMADEAFRKK